MIRSFFLIYQIFFFNAVAFSLFWTIDCLHFYGSIRYYDSKNFCVDKGEFSQKLLFTLNKLNKSLYSAGPTSY